MREGVTSLFVFCPKQAAACMVCRQLEVVEGPLVDLEVRGVPALQYFGNKVWQ